MVKPDAELEKVPTVGDPRWALHTIAICTQPDNALLQDGFKSFPSGHSSSMFNLLSSIVQTSLTTVAAFAGLFYLSLYLSAKMHVLDSKGEVWKTFIVLVPSLGAALVAGSRIMDARHHPFDVLSGSAMGILVAWGSYRQYFPPVSETWRKGRAYPIRIWGKQPQRTPTIEIDEDVEPLRPMGRPADLEEGASSGFAAHTAIAREGDEHSGNVFRQQISQSQRRRQEEGRPYPVQHSDTMGSTLSTKVSRYQNQLPSTNPFANDPRARGRDHYDYSSSEDDENFELQPQSGAYNQVAGTLTDTGYHPPTHITPVPTPPPPTQAPHSFPGRVGPSGDLGETQREAAPTVPPHAAGTTS